jgi:hypothetical protein
MTSSLDRETKSNVDASQAKILAAIKETGSFHSLTVEYHSNGIIKRIEKNLNPVSVLTLGISATVFGVTVYFKGPDKVTEYAKVALAVAQAAEAVSNVAHGRPVSNLVYN